MQRNMCFSQSGSLIRANSAEKNSQHPQATKIIVWIEVIVANPFTAPPPLPPFFLLFPSLCLMWRYTSVLKHQTEAIAFHFHN